VVPLATTARRLGRAGHVEFLLLSDNIGKDRTQPLVLHDRGGGPGAPATYVGMCHPFCDSVEAFQTAMGPHAKEIMGDIKNYTDIAPVMQISEVIVG